MVGRLLGNSVTRLAVALAVMTCLGVAHAQPAEQTPSSTGIIYSNPRVYNVDYSFEITPDPNTVDRAKDLKVWIPVPREWDSQKAVKILSVQPEPHARYVDPEYGNSIFYWDFGKLPPQPTYRVKMAFRLESYEVSVKVDPNRVGPYDKTSKEYALYTRSTRTVHITPKIRDLAREAVGDETNPYLQAERIVKFVGKKMHYKILDYERGRGIDCLLAYPVTDEKTGQEYYEGCCNQHAALMVALCRAVGIPARCVSAYIGWNPSVDPNNVKAKYPFETKLSPDGLTTTQLYGALGSHMWGEFFIPGYGWVPADPQRGTVGRQRNAVWIKTKGRDILLGPDAPPRDSEGYGTQWVTVHDGRADALFNAVANIAKGYRIKATVLHHSDPFPADALAGYPGNPHPSGNAEQGLRHWRQGVLSWPSRCVRDLRPESLNLDQFYRDYPRCREERQSFVCHMLRGPLGDGTFYELTNAYLALRQKSGQAVPTSRFEELAETVYGKPLRWFFDQWVNGTDVPRLKLEKVAVRKDKEDWQIQGRLVQLGNTAFRMLIEFAIDTRNGREKQRLWIEKKATDFEFRTRHEPLTLVVDPDYEVLKVQKMPPRLSWSWDVDPEFVVIYGTSGEAQANESTAERFAEDYLGYDRNIIKADTDVNDADLKTKCVFLIGRPETNRVAQQFKDSFPIRLGGTRFSWQGTTYDKPTQGVAQVIDSPIDGKGLMIMYAGLSSEATLKLCDLGSYDSDSSYVIFDGDKRLVGGDWEDVDANLYWSADSHPSPGLVSSQAH
jgi:transglutaminase-like putative cysteine protease